MSNSLRAWPDRRPFARPSARGTLHCIRAESLRSGPIANDLIRVRPVCADDLDALYAICLATGDNGRDATALYRDPKLLGHIYAAPYALFSPGCGLVAEDDAGVGGYVLGALDSHAFEVRLEAAWWPTLRPLYPDREGQPAPGWPIEAVRAWQIHHPFRTPRRLSAQYPSHLHIDLLPRLQGRGLGAKLIVQWLAEVKAKGSPGAHLGVGPANLRAINFYNAIGWSHLDLGLPGESVWFGKRL